MSAGWFAFDRSKCTGCNACVRLPEQGAQTVCTAKRRAWIKSQAAWKRDGVFSARSGGRLTLSGRGHGAAGFALALLREAKTPYRADHQSLWALPTDVLDQACRVLDALIFDIKCLDSAATKAGVGSELILKNIGHVFEHFPGFR